MGILLLLALPLCVTTIAKSDSQKNIIGGREAKKGEFPFTVYIRATHRCGGSLISFSKVVTAAHCFFEEDVQVSIKRFVVIGGTCNIVRSNAEGYQERRFQNVRLHEDYKFDFSMNDIAVGELDGPFYVSSTIIPMELVSTNPKKYESAWQALVAANATCSAVGWGKSNSGFDQNQGPDRYSPVLKVIKVRPWPNCTTNINSSNRTKHGEICAYPQENPGSICCGDSGGPLVCNGFGYGLLKGGRHGCGENNLQVITPYWPYINNLFLKSDALDSRPIFLHVVALIISTTCEHLL